MIGLMPITEALRLSSVDADEYGTDDLYDVADVLPHVRHTEGYPRLLAQVRERGIDIPVLIRERNGQRWLEDGHHRIAAALDAGLTEIPWSDLPLQLEQ